MHQQLIEDNKTINDLESIDFHRLGTSTTNFEINDIWDRIFGCHLVMKEEFIGE